MEVKEVYQQLEKQFPGKVGDFKGDVPEPYLLGGSARRLRKSLASCAMTLN